MKISIIMATMNAERTIAEAIDSFMQQDHPEKELLVMDGASIDRTVAVAQSFNCNDIKVFSEPDVGLYDGMNKGLRLMTGDAFGCLNSDDLYASPTALSRIAEALTQSDVVSGGLRFFRSDAPSNTLRVWNPASFSKGAYQNGFSLPHPSTYARRGVYDAIGGFSTKYGSASDYEWLLRALEIHGFRHSVIDEILVSMRLGGESTAGLRSVLRNSKELLEIRREYLGSGLIDRAIVLNLLIKISQVASNRLATFKKD